MSPNVPRERSTEPALLLEGVAKSFPRRRPVRELLRRPFGASPRVPAVRGVSFRVGPGELVGLLGPNGAGKTTILKMLCGLIVPDAGHVLAFGRAASGPELSRLVGLVHGDERSFYWRLTARENLHFFARLYGLRGAERDELVERLLSRVDLASEGDRRFGDFSSGMKQRMAIARSLLADPPVLLMDEPTRSLDPVSAESLRSWVLEELHGKDGKAILLATHNLREAERLCRRVVVLSRGEVRADETPAELRRRGVGGSVYRLRLSGVAFGDSLESGRILESTDSEGVTTLLVQLADDEGLDGLLAELQERGRRIFHCAPEQPELETVFHQLVSEEERP